ncbi:membrane hypothetical protein [[Clostridium] ultunense Esp]|nr:membrane hypothetical protein [[Clostridium] ultunense Esp]
MMKSTGLDNMNRTHQDIVDVILIVGNFDRRSFVDQTKSYPRDQSAVLIGSKVRSLNVGDTVELGLNNKKQYRVTGRLMEGEGYLEKRWYRSLDDSLVVFTTFKEAVALYEMAAIYDFIPNIHLIHPSEGLISQVQEMANKTKKLTLIPETRGVKKVLEGYFLQNIITIISYFLFVFSVAFFTISAFIAMLRFTISKNEVEYLTHQIYGATLWRLRIRITSFISMIVFVPFVVFLFLFRPIILKFEGGAMILWGNLLAAVFIILFASFFSAQKLREKDIMTMIRRD